MSIFVDNIHNWQTFYVLLGTISAILLGLLFVALSLGSGEIYKKKVSIAIKILINPIYYQFLTVLVISILMIIPTQSQVSLAVLLLVVVVYNWFEQIKRYRLMAYNKDLISFRTRINSIIFSTLSSILILSSSLYLFLSVKIGLFLLSIVSIFLLLLGIANTWQIMTYIIIQKNKDIQ